MHDLATIQRINHEAYADAVKESMNLFQKIQAQLADRGFFAEPVLANHIVVAVDYYRDDNWWGRVFLDPDSFFGLW